MAVESILKTPTTKETVEFKGIVRLAKVLITLTIIGIFIHVRNATIDSSSHGVIIISPEIVIDFIWCILLFAAIRNVEKRGWRIFVYILASFMFISWILILGLVIGTERSL